MSRFIRSRIGGIWMIINPLVQVCIYIGSWVMGTRVG